MDLLKRNELIKGFGMCMRQLVLNVKTEQVIKIEEHLDWADNYGLSDDDLEGWEECRRLEIEKNKLMKEIEELIKYIN